MPNPKVDQQQEKKPHNDPFCYTHFMSQTFLSGRVILEKITNKRDEKGRFRSKDHRGEISLFLSHDQIEFAEYCEFKDADVTRGFHYHKEYTEYVYVISGELLLAVKSIDSQKQDLIPLTQGDLVTIPGNIAHALKSLEKSSIISAGTGTDPFEDRHPYIDLEFSLS